MNPPIPTSCSGCGCCCLEQESPPGYVLLLAMLEKGEPIPDEPRLREDLARLLSLPPELRAELDAYIVRLKTGQGHPNNFVCLWFDEVTRQCKHYDLRPGICRDELQIGDEGCLHWRKEYQHLLQIEPAKPRPKIVIPPFLSHLLVDRGYPVPHFVAIVNGRPEFRCIDAPKTLSIARNLECWVCGKTANAGEIVPRWFLAGPIATANHYTTEGPMHEACARYSIATCPYLLGNSDRREANMPEGTVTQVGAVRARPPMICLLHADSYGAKTVNQNGHRYAAWDIGKYLDVEYFRNGEPIPEATALALRDSWGLWREYLKTKAAVQAKQRKAAKMIRERDKRRAGR